MQRSTVDLKKIKIIGFDCDGVLFDSTKANQAYYNHILDQVGLPPMTAEQFAYAHMHTVEQTLAFLIQEPKLLAAAHEYRRSLSYLPFIRYMRMEPHLRALIHKLRPVYKTAIATNRTDTMERVLAEHELEGAFDMVVTARDVKHPKPHPEQLFRILNHFRVQADQMLYVGDSELDARAARQAGVPFAAYLNSSLEADLHIEGLDRIGHLLSL